VLAVPGRPAGLSPRAKKFCGRCDWLLATLVTGHVGPNLLITMHRGRIRVVNSVCAHVIRVLRMNFGRLVFLPRRSFDTGEIWPQSITMDHQILRLWRLTDNIIVRIKPPHDLIWPLVKDSPLRVGSFRHLWHVQQYIRARLKRLCLNGCIIVRSHALCLLRAKLAHKFECLSHSLCDR